MPIEGAARFLRRFICQYDEAEDLLWIGLECSCAGDACIHSQSQLVEVMGSVIVAVNNRGRADQFVSSVALTKVSTQPLLKLIFFAIELSARRKAAFHMSFPSWLALIFLLALAGCASQPHRRGIRVAIVEVKTEAEDIAGIRTALEAELLARNITVVWPEQPLYAPVYEVFVSIHQNIGMATVFSLGLLPYSIDTSARVFDRRTGALKAAVCSTSYGSVFSSRGLYRGVRRAAKEIAKKLRRKP